MAEESTVVTTEEDTTQAATEAAVSSRDYEAEARASGWVPEAEFKGDKKPAVFLDAETFVKRGEEITPFIRKENSKLRQELTETKADFAKRLERMEKATTRAFEAQKSAHEQELARVRREQRSAAESGDMKEFDRLETIKGNLEKAAPKAEETETVDPNAGLPERQQKWRAANPWFDEDFDMQDFAVRYSDFHGQRNPHLSFEENMKAVEAKVREKFPEKFGGKPAANGHAAVDGGGSFPGATRGKGKTAADLPAEAKAAGERFVAQKLYKDLNAYAKEYFND